MPTLSSSACTFALYPLQMGFWPNHWYSELLKWPDQHAAMATFVYAPVCTSLALVMFCATLFERRLIGPRAIVALAVSIPLLLAGTVIGQDVYFGSTSTQQLLLGVAASDPTPLIRSIFSVH
jgi:hypothetical protein